MAGIRGGMKRMAKPKKPTTARASSDRTAEATAGVLARYAKKRDFSVTPEPPPAPVAPDETRGESKEKDELPVEPAPS